MGSGSIAEGPQMPQGATFERKPGKVPPRPREKVLMTQYDQDRLARLARAYAAGVASREAS